MDILITDQSGTRINKRLIKETVLSVLKLLNQPEGACLSICFLDTKGITGANKRYFKKNKATDVIAFANSPARRDFYRDYLGDIIICPQQAKKNAKSYETSLEYELTLYIVHGILHLLGYDDVKTSGRRNMMKEQDRIMEKIWRRKE